MNKTTGSEILHLYVATVVASSILAPNTVTRSFGRLVGNPGNIDSTPPGGGGWRRGGGDTTASGQVTQRPPRGGYGEGGWRWRCVGGGGVGGVTV